MKQGNEHSLILCARDLSFHADPVRVELLAKSLSGLTSPAIVLGLNTEETAALNQRGFSFYQEADFEHAPFMSDVNRAANETAANWFRSPGVRECLTYKGVNLGEMLQHPMTYFLLTPLRAIALVDGLFAQKTITSCLFFPLGSGGPEPLPVTEPALLTDHWVSSQPGVSKQENRNRGSFMRAMLGLVWKAVNFVISLRAGGEKTVLVSSDTKHAAPVMAELEKKGTFRFTFIREQFPARLLKPFFQKSISLESVCARPGSGEKLRKELSFTLETKRPFTFKNTDYWVMIREIFLEKFIPRMEQERSLVDSFHSLLNRKKIDFILVDEDVCPYNKTLITVANQKNIPSCVIQHGAPFPIVAIALAPVSCTKIAAWGNTTRDMLLNCGVSDSKIEVTGVPRYDSFRIKPADPKDRARIAAELNIPADKKWLVFATDPFHEPGRADFVGNYLTQDELRKLVQTVARAAQRFPECRLILKLHPRDRYESFARAWIREMNMEGQVWVTRSFPTPRLLPHTEVLLTVCSTVAIEAMLCDKPVITLNMQSGEDLQPHRELGVALGAKDEQTLIQALDRCLNDESTKQNLRARREQVIPEYIGPRDGKASARAAEIIETLTAQRQAVPAGAR